MVGRVPFVCCIVRISKALLNEGCLNLGGFQVLALLDAAEDALQQLAVLRLCLLWITSMAADLYIAASKHKELDCKTRHLVLHISPLMAVQLPLARPAHPHFDFDPSGAAWCCLLLPGLAAVRSCGTSPTPYASHPGGVRSHSRKPKWGERCERYCERLLCPSKIACLQSSTLHKAVQREWQ